MTHFSTPATRQDCVRDNRFVKLPYKGWIAGNLWRAKRGNWILYHENDRERIARVIGRVTCEGKIYIEAVAMYGARMSLCLRWIDPDHVVECLANPPRNAIAFITGDWSDPVKVMAKLYNGIPSDLQCTIDLQNTSKES